MKVGIITFHASYNCGSILQCMALREVLLRKGAQVDIINFSSLEQQKLYSVFYKKITLKNMVKNILCIPGYKMISKHYEQYAEYINKEFNLTDKIYFTSNDIKDNITSYDMLIAGGDQVWNVNCDDFHTAYFLDFDDNTYKISYAPSLGATNINKSDKVEEYKKLLNQFDDISCREVNGAKWLEELLGRKVKLILDPTMLLTRDEWEKNVTRSIVLPFENEFIFYYAFSYSKENNGCVQRIAEENNMKVAVIDSKQWYIKGLNRYKNFVLLEETGPNAFLNLMAGSKYVFTTSFHGTVFSILYHKKFVYMNSKNHAPTDDRTSFLVKQLGVEDHYLYVEDVSTIKLEDEIDYTEIDRRIKKLREESFEYLDSNMKKAQGRK